MHREHRRAGEREKLQQREKPPPRVVQGWKRNREFLCVPYRAAAECSMLLVIASWALTIYAWSTRAPSCAPPHASSGVGRSPVAIVSSRRGLAWSVSDEGVVGLAERELEEAAAAPSRQAFHLEWQPKHDVHGHHFCLRWLRDMRLVEVASADAPDAFMLKLSSRFACEDPSAYFAVRGSSLFSIGVGSLVNTRDTWHVRAHGDTGPPWQPMLSESRDSKVAIEALPDRRDYVERSLLDLVRRLELNASTRAGAVPAPRRR